VYCVLPGQGGESDKIVVALIDEFTNKGHTNHKVSLTFEVDQVTFKIWEDGTLIGTLSGRVEE
jgi:hypothetical protein